MPSESAEDARIRAETEWCASPFVPELPLHLITPRCRLWAADATQLAEVDWPEPWWAFAWPGGQALARLLLDQPELVAGRTVLSVGAGGAIETLAAARAGAQAIANDIDPWALRAARLNAERNGLTMAVDGRDLIGRDEGWSVVLAADVSYAEDLAQRVAPWLTGLSRRGAEVYLAEPRRGFLTPPGPPVAEYLTPDDADPTGALCRRTPVWRL